MEYQGLTITSQLVGIGKRESNDGFKSKYEILFPKYLVTVNGEDFSYSGSAYDLANAFKLKNSALYLRDGNEIYADTRNGTRNTFNNVKTDRLQPKLEDLQELTASAMGKKELRMGNKAQLFALHCIIQDALMTFENADIGEFADSFGYTDIKECLRIWNACADTRARLKLSESKLYEILEKLSEDGIE